MASASKPQEASAVSKTKMAEPKQWNTDKLAKRIATDLASAGTAAAAISPIITIIDKAIIEKAAKGLSIRDSVSGSVKQLFSRPLMFLGSTPFLLIYMLYSSTYVTANLIDTCSRTISSERGAGGFEEVTTGPAKFMATTVVNMSMCVYKDSRFAKFFGDHKPSNTPPSTRKAATSAAGSIPKHPPMPKTSLGLFCARDSLTIFASFNLPPLLAPSIPDFIAPSAVAKASVAQFVIPSAVQIVSTPIHLLGLDLYNRQRLPVPGADGKTLPVPASERWRRVKRDWMPSFGARIARIAPAFGVGGVLNARMRAMLMGSIERSA
ncbi:hypothetical protein KEM56_002944 [Ascosphaera pollenicola]|nr:hypothetical protein KEM56_002944 [Ascosphaera pollenicola]